MNRELFALVKRALQQGMKAEDWPRLTRLVEDKRRELGRDDEPEDAA